MPVEAMGALGSLVLDRVEERGIVGRPSRAGDAFGAKRQQRSAPQIFDLERVLAKAGGVQRMRKQAIVVANLIDAEAEKGMAFGKLVQVQQYLFAQRFFRFAAAMDGVLFAFLGSREVI